MEMTIFNSVLWKLTTLCLIHKCASTSTMPPETTTMTQEEVLYDPTPPELCQYNFTGPSDDIFIIDRSASFNMVRKIYWYISNYLAFKMYC